METRNRNIHILVIAPTPFFADRGCHVRILEQVRMLQVRGYSLTICTYHHGQNVQGLEIKRSLRIPWYSKLSAGPSIHKFYVDLLLMAKAVKVSLKDRPDIIHAYLHEGIPIGKLVSILLRIPFVADIQGSLSGELVQHRFVKARGFFYQLFYKIEMFLVKLPDIVFVSSSNLLADLPDSAKRIPGRVLVLNDGVDTECFSPCDQDKKEIRDKLNVPVTKKIVGYLGVLTDYQGISILLEAIPHVLSVIQDVHFLIMGYPNVEYYAGKARELGVHDHISFTGRVPYEQAPKHLAICDVAVSPKLYSTEANGKLLNYMAMSLPVIASDTPVNRQILGDCGIYVQAGDPLELAKAISQILSDPDYARTVGTQLRNRAVKEFSQQTIGDLISETYQTLVNNQYGLAKR